METEPTTDERTVMDRFEQAVGHTVDTNPRGVCEYCQNKYRDAPDPRCAYCNGVSPENSEHADMIEFDREQMTEDPNPHKGEGETA